MTTTTRKLPSQSILGRSINMLNNPNIFKLESLIKSGNLSPIIDIVGQRDIEIPGIHNQMASIGDNIDIADIGARTVETTLKVMTGSEVIKSFSTDASVSGTYSALSVSASGSYSYESSVKRDDTYAFISGGSHLYMMYIKSDDIFTHLNAKFLEAARALPEHPEHPEHPELPAESSSMQCYKNFFQSWGTHVIRKCIVGSRYQLKVQTSNVSSSDKESFTASVEANYAKILDAKVNVEGKKVETRYKNLVQGEAEVMGGSDEKNRMLAHSNNDENAFREWVQSRGAGENDTTTNIEVDAISDLLMLSPTKGHREIGQRLKVALQALLQKPRSVPIHLHGYITGCLNTSSVSMEAWGASVRLHPEPLLPTTLSEDENHKCFTLRPGKEGLVRFVSAGITIEGITGEEVTFAKWTDEADVTMKLFPQGVEGGITIHFPYKGSKKVVLPSLTAVGSYTA